MRTLKTLYKGNILLDEKVASSEKDLTIVTKQVQDQEKNLDDVILVNGGTDALFISMINNFSTQGMLKQFT